MGKEFIEKIHYYLENGKIVFTEQYHINRGFCCGNNCRHCAYEPKHKKGNKELKNAVNNTSTFSSFFDT
jgi:hypothetical protein